MITYREATSDDLPAVCVLGQEINAIHHSAWPEVFAPSGDPARDEGLWREMIGVADATTFVAQSAGAVIGFANVLFVARDKNPLLQPISYARVGSVGITESHRGQGIGTELMRRVEAWAAAKGAKHVTLNVWAFNKRAVEMYEKLGYEVRSHSMGKRLSSAHRSVEPRQVVLAWVEAFNRADVDALVALYSEDAVNHQVVEEPVQGRENIRGMFVAAFASATMVCIVENIFEDGEWAILEWRDPLGLRGCGFFHILDGRIVFQRGYWDKATFLRVQGLE